MKLCKIQHARVIITLSTERTIVLRRILNRIEFLIHRSIFYNSTCLTQLIKNSLTLSQSRKSFGKWFHQIIRQGKSIISNYDERHWYILFLKS